ncbi:hypothetical protein [Georgenia deserti]|uniref:Cellulose biosynthesis cyclic di-GMP-binding regulatory protein BcsB n=1 Tax=Georgenia deserti TaxID=2093781 RepID=A0ABW4L8I5_9MICO
MHRQRPGPPRGRPRAPRVFTLVGLVLAALLVTPGAAVPAAAAPVLVEEGELEAVDGTTDTLTVDVPDGVSPSRVTGTLASSYEGGTVDLLIGDEVVASHAGSGSRPVDVDVPAGSVVDRELEVALRYTVADPATEEICRALEPTTGSLTDLEVHYEGTEAPPSTVGDFFPATSPLLVAQLPEHPSEAQIQAALTAVASLSWRYGAPTDVRIGAEDETFTDPAAGTRAVRFVEEPSGSDGAAAHIEDSGDVPALVLTGNADQLHAAATALRDPAISLGNAASVEDLARSASERRPGLTRSLADVTGSDRLELAGWGTTEAYVGVRQDLFSGPIDHLDVHVTGTHTAVPADSWVQLDLLVNDRLVDSVALPPQSEDRPDVRFDLDANVAAAHLTAETGVVLRLSALPAEGRCVRGPDTLPLSVDVDTAASTVEASRGTSVSGFDRFPQAFAGELPVAVRGDGDERAERATRAGDLVSALQRAAAYPVDVTLEAADDLVGGGRNGMVVGATDEDAEAVGAPLRLSTVRDLTHPDALFSVSSTEPFAALQAASADGRDVLLLGAWPGSDESAATTSLEQELTGEPIAENWWDLDGDVLVATGDSEPFSLESGTAGAQNAEDRAPEADRDGMWWWIGGALVVVLLLAGAGLLANRRRRRRIAELVDAQEAAERHGDQGESPEQPDERTP